MAALVVAILQVAGDFRRFQQGVDLGSRVETIVENETQIGREFQIDAMGDLRAQRLLVALERGDRLFGALAAERP